MPFRTLISVAELASHLEEPDWVIVDCRFSLHDTELGREQYLGAHIPGAVYAHLDADLSGPVVLGSTGRHPLPPPEAAAESFGSWGITNGVQVVAYDDAGGGIAARLWWLLHYLGHDASAVLDGGWQAWTGERQAAASCVESNDRRTFTPEIREGWIVDAAEVDAVRRDPSWKLLDARDARRFRGEDEPIDPVAGHIPGALSVPFLENVDQAGKFLPRDVLRDRFGEIVGSTPPERVVSHCGSGVTACHHILAMAHAGLPGARLYPGSWSEWITDPDRPVSERGREGSSSPP